jgi:hypothetical protein
MMMICVKGRSSYCALARPPSYKHSEESQKESITGNTIASVSLVNPQIRRLNIEVEGISWPINPEGVDIVLLIQQPAYHGTNQS